MRMRHSTGSVTKQRWPLVRERSKEEQRPRDGQRHDQGRGPGSGRQDHRGLRVRRDKTLFGEFVESVYFTFYSRSGRRVREKRLSNGLGSTSSPSMRSGSLPASGAMSCRTSLTRKRRSSRSRSRITCAGT